MKKVFDYIKTWETRCYKKGIPDEVPLELEELAPSYKKIAVAILSNDLHFTSLGFSTPKSKWYSILKKIEIRKKRKGYKK